MSGKSWAMASDGSVPDSIEQFEDRTLLAATAIFNNGTLQILADTDLAIVVRENPQVSGELQVLADGQSLVTSSGTVTTDQVTDINILTGEVDNSVDLSGVTASAFPNIVSIVVQTGDGNDLLIGSLDYANSLRGGDGNDTLFGQSGADTLRGDDGNDQIAGSAGDDLIDGGDGDDSITGDAGNDRIFGGDGHDSISAGDGNDSVNAGDGNDFANGDNGSDTISGDGGMDTLGGDAGDDTLFGGAHGDVMNGGDGNDSLDGQSGPDSISGDAGNDLVDGEGGNDTLAGGDGNDTVLGDNGADQLEGGPGDDLLRGGSGSDQLFDEGAGVTASPASLDTLLGEGGDDTIFAFSGADSIDGGLGDDFIDTRAVRLFVDDLAISPEGDFGQTQQVFFNVRLSSAFPRDVTVDFATSSDGTATGGTATAGTDYVATTGTLTIPAGQTTATIPVTIRGDNLDEAEETFFMNLSNPVGARIGDGLAEGRIFDDDQPALGGTIDIFLLLDDTASFSATGPVIQSAFNQIITDLQTNFPGSDLAFGVGRFEAYTGGNRPFVLNQPVITDDTTNFQSAIDAALQRIAPGGGISEEPGFEALFQIATGAGFDGNGDGDTVDDGPAGLFTTQTNTTSGDVPAFSTFQPDPTGDPNGPILAPTVGVASATDGVGFRPGARHIVLLATDSFSMVHEDDGNTVYTGVNGTTEPAATFANGIINTPGARGAGIQETIDALIAEEIEVIGLGESFLFGSLQSELTAIASLTGAINNTSNPIENNLTPGPSADDIQPGDPLYFEIDSNDSAGLANSIVQAVVGAVGNQQAPPPPPPPPPPPVVAAQEDTIDGGLGSDTILAGDSDDILIGSADNDSLDGGAGNDTIIGGAGDDTLNGGDGDDVITGQSGNDVVDGGAGQDTFIWKGTGHGIDSTIGGDGQDTVSVVADDGDNTLRVSQDSDEQLTITEGVAVFTADPTIEVFSVSGGDGNDTIILETVRRVGLISLNLLGGAGDDTINASGALLGEVVLRIDGGAGNDRLTGTAFAERINGGDDDDTIVGNAGADQLFGDAGNDQINGGIGADTIEGNDGNDRLFGDDDDDVISGGVGFDVVDGGAGNDTVSGGDDDDSVNGAAGNDLVSGGNGNDRMAGGTGNDTLNGGSGNDSIQGQADADTILGGDGDDRLDGGGGDDEILGGDGDDDIIGGDGNDGIAAGNGHDSVNGGLGHDLIAGGDGNDTIFGGGGNDTLLGQQGSDLLTGNSGTDTAATGEGFDSPEAGDPLPANQIEIIDESFRLTADLLLRLDGV